MKRSSKIILIMFVTTFFLSACGATKGTIRTSVDQKFEFSEVEKIKRGMSETQVIELLGRPTAFGIDEQGREYLLYQLTTLSSTMGMVFTPVGGTIASTSLKGFEVRIYLQDGKVQGIGYTQYQKE